MYTRERLPPSSYYHRQSFEGAPLSQTRPRIGNVIFRVFTLIPHRRRRRRRRVRAQIYALYCTLLYTHTHRSAAANCNSIGKHSRVQLAREGIFYTYIYCTHIVRIIRVRVHISEHILRVYPVHYYYMCTRADYTTCDVYAHPLPFPVPFIVFCAHTHSHTDPTMVVVAGVPFVVEGGIRSGHVCGCAYCVCTYARGRIVRCVSYYVITMHNIGRSRVRKKNKNKNKYNKK